MSIPAEVKIPKIHFEDFELGKLRPHPRYRMYGEWMALSDMVINDVTILSMDVAINLLWTHPIVGVETKGQYIHYISGSRTFQVAKSHFAESQLVPVTVIRSLGADKIAEMVDSDLLINPMLFSSKRPSHLGDLYQSIPNSTLCRLFPEISDSKTKFAQAIGFAYNTVFPPAAKKKGEA